jgi:hypothetical protein
MPRLLVNLRRALAEDQAASGKPIKLPKGLIPKKPQRTLNRPIPKLPAFTGRSKSVLLDEIQFVKSDRENAFLYHKKLPPHVRLSKKQKDEAKKAKPGDDVPREMTEEERTWYSSPWRQLISLASYCSLNLFRD